VPVELHIYAGTGHGFGLRANHNQPAAKWIERFEDEAEALRCQTGTSKISLSG